MACQELAESVTSLCSSNQLSGFDVDAALNLRIVNLL